MSLNEEDKIVFLNLEKIVIFFILKSILAGLACHPCRINEPQINKFFD